MTDDFPTIQLWRLYSQEEADNLYNQLLSTCPFQSIDIYGKVPKRRVCAYAKGILPPYHFSGTTVNNNDPADNYSVMRIWNDLNSHRGSDDYNYVLLNYYPDGTSYISPHSDDESCIDQTVPIATVSLGATRDMLFRRPYGGKSQKVALDSGSLLMMMYNQRNWKHSIPVRKNVKLGRISLTFRKMKVCYI